MSILFQPLEIGNIKAKNRIVRSATQDWLGTPDGCISEKEIELYEALAANEVGLIITAHSYVEHPAGRASIRQNGIYDDRFIPGYRKLADTVHKHGALIVIQISHAGRQTAPELAEGLVPLAPSPVVDGSTGVMPREMTEDEIWTMINRFAEAADRARRSGVDGVQLHIAHGYCLSQFISPYTNRRADGWGGSSENRLRILKEIMLRCRSAAGPDYPIFAKLNSTDGVDLPGYLTLKDAVQAAILLKSLGISGIEVSGGIREHKGVMSRPGINSPDAEAYFAPAAQAIKKAVDIPIMLVGGLRSVQVMEKVIEDGFADMVSLCRPFIKQPDLVLRLSTGAQKADCVSCNACFKPQGLQCFFENE